MSNFLGFLLFLPPLLGLLAAIHFRTAIRSRHTIWLLAGSILVVGATAFQLLAMMFALAFEPTQGTIGWKAIGLMGYMMWPQTVGNLMFFTALYFVARELHRGRGGA